MTIELIRGFQGLPPIRQLITEQLQGIDPRQIYSREQIAALVAKSRLVHITSHFPVNGRILARNRFKFPENRLDPRLGEIFRHSLSVIRSTVHFAPNGVVPEHKEQLAIAPEQAIAIIQPTKQSRILGGYLEDIFCIGSVLLSEDSTIIVPTAFGDHPQTAKQLATLPKTISVIYRDKEETIRAAVKRVLDRSGVENLSPISVTDPTAPIFVFEDSKTKMLLATDWVPHLKARSKRPCRRIF